jgi:hypothetical protein
VAHTDATSDLQTYTEAMARHNAAKWELTCNDKRRAFECMGIFEIVPRPADHKVVGSKWVFRIKHGPDSAIQKYKAHVVMQGFSQVEGINYDKTFAPIAKFASFQAILALAAKHDLEIHQMDVKSAYLNGEVKEEIYMQAPPSFDIPDGMALKLLKAVYGTKQGGHIGYENICTKLMEMGYYQTEADHTMFVHTNNSTISIILLYVDDINMFLNS